MGATRRSARRHMAVMGMAGVLVLGAAACGGSNAELQASVATQFRTILPLDEPQSACLAGQMIDIYGTAEMERFVADPQTYQPTDDASSDVTLTALRDCGIDPTTLVGDRSVTITPEEPVEIQLEPVEESSTTTGG